MSKAAAIRQPSQYELLATRLQKIINSPAAQKSKTALLYKAPDESEDDWAQVLAEIGETDNVTIAYRDDGGVHLFWVVQQDD
ncbi:MAG: DUF1654 domain-containing protein [Pseudomonas sp.]|uniref:DUF1654 domain-containing protein n=1 Tax=Pseudomonas sp. TaxID=306 RepID=UPI0030EFEFCF